MSAALPLPADTPVPEPGPTEDTGAADAPLLEATRRRLTERQAEMVAELVRAAGAEVDEVGYDGVTVRGVARRAGVAPATAYHYFSSKDHLLAEILWRHVQALEPVTEDGRPMAERLEEAVRGLVVFAAESQARADACTAALLGSNPDVKHLRDRIGARIHRRLAAAVGPDVDPDVVRVLETSYVGALVMAGMGHLPYLEIPAFVTAAAQLILGGEPPRANRRSLGDVGHHRRPRGVQPVRLRPPRGSLSGLCPPAGGGAPLPQRRVRLLGVVAARGRTRRLPQCGRLLELARCVARSERLHARRPSVHVLSGPRPAPAHPDAIAGR